MDCANPYFAHNIYVCSSVVIELLVLHGCEIAANFTGCSYHFVHHQWFQLPVGHTYILVVTTCHAQ